MRSRLYQIIETLSTIEKNQVRAFLQETIEDLPTELWEKLLKEKFLENGILCQFPDKDSLCLYISKLKTKKRSQQALDPNQVSPTIQGNPHDLIHYEKLRPITIREMARLQSFPDWFEFRSKRETGGLKRRFEVPQLTQVGNAVPPLLGKQIAKMISYLNNLSV